MGGYESVRVPVSMSAPVLTFEEFSALRQRKRMSSGLITDTESHSDQKKLDSHSNTNEMEHEGQKLDFGHLMQVRYLVVGQ